MIEKNKNIKILRIISRMNVGGPSKHVANISDSLNKYGYKTRILSGLPTPQEGNMFNIAKEKQLELMVIEEMGRSISPIKDCLSLIKIYKQIKAFKPDIVHTHTSKAGVLGRIAALICGVPNIYHTYHGHIFKGYFSKSATSFIILIERLLARSTTNLIALTPKLAQEINYFLKLSNPSKIKVIPLGLELEKNLQTPRHLGKWRSTHNFKQNDFIIGIVARLVPIKNHQMLIDSMTYLTQQIPNLHLAIIGKGELESSLKNQVKNLHLESNIHFIGNETNMEEAYSDLDLLVLCSKNEGTPVTIIEALASGCPVGATNVGGILEIFQQIASGSLLASEPNAFKNDLLHLIKNVNEIAVSEIQRQAISNFYSVNKLAKNISSLYKREPK